MSLLCIFELGARRLERRSLRQGAAGVGGEGGEDSVAPLQTDAPVPAPAAGGASPSRRRSVLRAERGMLGQSRDSTASGLEAGGFEEGAGGDNSSSSAAGSGSSPKSGDAIGRNATFDPFAAVEQDDGELTSLVSGVASPRRRRRLFGRRSNQNNSNGDGNDGGGASNNTGDDDGGTGAAGGGNARDSSRAVPPQLRYAAERDDPNAPGPVLWHPQRLAKSAQRKLGPLAVGGVGMGRAVPAIAVSPRLQDAALGQGQGGASAAPKRWGWLSKGRGLASSDGGDGVASEGGEGLSAAAAAAAAQTTVGWTGSGDGISSYGGGAAVLTNQQPAVTRLLSSGSLRERVVRDLVALASHAAAQAKSSSGEQNEGQNSDGDGNEGGNNGIAALRAAGEAQRALADLRRRGFATLDDVLDDDGVLLGCEDPVIPHAVRLCRDTDDLPDAVSNGGGGVGRGRNNGGFGGYGRGATPPPPPPPLGSGQHRPAARSLGPGRATAAPQVVMRSPTTGVGPSTQSEGHHHSHSHGGSVELAVRVLKLAVHDHPLFCPEDRLALLLRQAHSAYVTELERDPCRYLALRLAAAVHELQKLAPHASPQFSGRDQGRRRGSNDEGNNNFYDSEGDANNKDASAPEEDPALAKLIALAYPNAGLYAGPNNFGLDHLSSSGDNSNAAGGSAGIPSPAPAADQCDLLWRDACDTLSSLLDAETTARQTTKRVYRLWRALQAARRDAAVAAGQPAPSSGNTTSNNASSSTSSQKSKSKYFNSRRGSGTSESEQTPVNGGENSRETSASGDEASAPRAVCATPLRLRLTARSPAAVANGCVDVLPAVEALLALHDRLAKISMALVHKRFRRDTPAAPPPVAFASGASPNTTRRSDRRRRSGPNATGLETSDNFNEGIAQGGKSSSGLGDDVEQVGYQEARRVARERHDAVKKLLTTAKAFFAGETGDSSSSSKSEAPSRRGSGTKEGRKGSRRSSLDMAVDSSIGGGSGSTSGGAIGVGSGRFAFLLALSNDGEKTPLPQLSLKERRRRHRLARAGFYVVLCVNDPEDAVDCSGGRKEQSGCWGCCGSSSSNGNGGGNTSRSSSLVTQRGMATRIRIPAWGSVPFSDVDLKVVEFKGVGEEVRLQVRHRPHSLSLRLYARGGSGTHAGMSSGRDTLLACVPLPLPGRGSALEGASPGALAADARWYQWACAVAMQDPQSALWLRASKAAQQHGWLQTLALTLWNGALPKAPMRWSLAGGAEEGTENDPDHGVDIDHDDDNDGSRRSASRAAGAEALRAAAGEEVGDGKAAKKKGSEVPPAQASDSLLGARRRERTDVEAALVAKLLPGPRHCHGSVMVAARWELSPAASAAAHARLAARAAAASGGGSSAQNGYGAYSNDGGTDDGMLGEGLPDEKILLETTALVGRRLSRPWEGNSDPAHFPVPSFARESDFLRTLPKPGTTDPFDLASRSVRRHQFGMYDHGVIVSSSSSSGGRGSSSSSRGGNPSAFNLHVGEVVAGFFGVPAHVNAKGRIMHPAGYGFTGGGFGNVNASSSSTDWPLNASSGNLQLPPLSLPPLGVGGSNSQGLRRRALSNQELFAEPPRHTLLRARQRRPDASLFLRRPIPLNDSEVAAAEAYRPLLVAVAKSESSQDLASPMSPGAMSSNGGPLASPPSTSGSLLGTMRLAGLASALGQTAIMSSTSSSSAPQSAAAAAVDVASGAVLRSSKVENFARRVRDSRLAAVHARKRRAPLPLRRVVKETLPEDIDLGELIDLDDLMPQPARKLRPNALSTAAAGTDAGGGVPERLILTVVAADNVPTRMASTSLPFGRDTARYQRLSDSANNSGAGGGGGNGGRQQAGSGPDLQASNNSFGGAGFESVAALLMDDEDDEIDRETMEFESGRVRGVVEASLPHTGAHAATAVCPGRAPHWRETLVLDLNLPGDTANRDGLGSGGGGGGMGAGGAVADPAAAVLGDGRELVLSLFDEVLELDPNGGLGGRLQGHTQHRWRIERRFLGSVRVPLASLAATGRLEGCLKLETPDVNLGYDRSDTTKPRNGRRGAAQRQQQGYYDQLGDAAAGLGAAFGFSAGGFGSGALGGGGGGGSGDGNGGKGSSPTGALGSSGDFGNSGGGGGEGGSGGGGLDASLLASPAENNAAALRKRADAATYLRVAIVLDPPPTAAAQAAATATLASKGHQQPQGGSGEGDGSDYSSSSNETAALAAHARSWLESLHFEKAERAHVPSAMPHDRRWEVLAPNLEGDLVFICRFLRPGGLAPPPARAFPRSPSMSGGSSSGVVEDSFDEIRVDATMGRSRRSRRSARASLAAADQLNASATLAGVSGSDAENSSAAGSSAQDVCTVAAAARFVALVPFLEDYLGFRDLDLWCTCGQFLEVLAGDWEEHALLLWHYLVYLQDKGALDEPRSANNDQPSTAGTGSSSTRKRWTFYLVIGRAVPCGDAQYVLQLDQMTGEAILWDARSGEAFDASDTRLPLVDITVLATPGNCWANLQREGRPADLARQAGYGSSSLGGGSSSASQLAVLGSTLTSMGGFGRGSGGGGNRGNYRKGRGFDVDDPSKWKPFFPPNMPAAKKAQLLGAPGRPPTVQEARLVYPPPLSHDDCRELATRIQDRLRDAITSWRTASATSDHRAYPVFAPDTRAKILLQQLEHRKLGQWGTSSNSNSSSSDGGGGSGGNGGEGGDSSNGGAAIIDLRAESGSQRECFGVTLNCSYTDMAAIEERVKATGVHETGAADVLFLLAVHVVPYPCKVLSVWVFVGSMPRNAY